MRQKNRCRCILVLFLWIFYSCSQDCNIDPKVGLEKIIASDFISHFSGESITPYARKRGFVIFRSNDGGKFLVDQRTKKISKVLSEFASNLVQEKLAGEVANKLRILDEFCINGIISDSSITLVYTNFADSSYQDLIRADSTFRDIHYRSDKNKKYNYVLVNMSSLHHHNNKIISNLTRLHSLKKISDQWYYFRSQYYSSSP